jgi:hypothetical protein
MTCYHLVLYREETLGDDLNGNVRSKLWMTALSQFLLGLIQALLVGYSAGMNP